MPAFPPRRDDLPSPLYSTFGSGGTVTTVNPVAGVLIQTNGNVVVVESVGTDGIALQRFLGN